MKSKYGTILAAYQWEVEHKKSGIPLEPTHFYRLEQPPTSARNASRRSGGFAFMARQEYNPS